LHALVCDTEGESTDDDDCSSSGLSSTLTTASAFHLHQERYGTGCRYQKTASSVFQSDGPISQAGVANSKSDTASVVTVQPHSKAKPPCWAELESIVDGYPSTPDELVYSQVTLTACHFCGKQQYASTTTTGPQSHVSAWIPCRDCQSKLTKQFVCEVDRDLQLKLHDREKSKGRLRNIFSDSTITELGDALHRKVKRRGFAVESQDGKFVWYNGWGDQPLHSIGLCKESSVWACSEEWLKDWLEAMGALGTGMRWHKSLAFAGA